MISSSNEISLRHLPDISNVSFSFEIPVGPSGDHLLADDVDFFRGAHDGLITPVSTRTAHEPLTLSQLTPKPKLNRASPIAASPASLAVDQSYNPAQQTARNAIPDKPKMLSGLPNQKDTVGGMLRPRQRPKIVSDAIRATSEEGSVTTGRFENLKAQMESLVTDTRNANDTNSQNLVPVPTAHTRKLRPKDKNSEQKQSHMSKTKRTIAAGGITKPRKEGSKSLAAGFSRTVTSPSRIGRPDQHFDQTDRLDSNLQTQDEQPDGNTSICSSASGEAAERLVKYSQKLIDSFGLFNSEKLFQSSPTQATDSDMIIKTSHGFKPSDPNLTPILPGQDVMVNDVNDDNDLTLSQISPRKITDSAPTCHTAPLPMPTSPVPTSPMRPSRKRPVVVQEQPSRKKNKAEHGANSHVAGPVLLDTVLENGTETSSSGPGLGSHTCERTKGGPVNTSSQVREFRFGRGKGRQGRQPMPRTVISTAAESSSQAKPIEEVRQQQGMENSENTPIVTHGHQERYTGLGRSIKSASTLQHVNPTKAVGFKFQLDARMEARKAEFEKDKSIGRRQKKMRNLHPVPDFKALHAAQEAEMAARREQVMPVVPLPFELNTVNRAKERQRYDEMMKEREKELDRAVRLRMLERQEEEEKEVKELRKRAVPKAHEVPEWYKTAPRKKGAGGDTIRG